MNRPTHSSRSSKTTSLASRSRISMTSRRVNNSSARRTHSHSDLKSNGKPGIVSRTIMLSSRALRIAEAMDRISTRLNRSAAGKASGRSTVQVTGSQSIKAGSSEADITGTAFLTIDTECTLG